MFNKQKTFFILFIVCPLVTISFFQNCAPDTKSAYKAAGNLESDLIVRPKDTPPTELETKAEFNPLVANRVLTANILIDIFGKDASTRVSELIAYKGVDFGSGYTVYDRVVTPPEKCAEDKNPYSICVLPSVFSLGYKIPAIIGLNVRREGWRIQACEALTGSDELLFNSILRVDAASKPATLPQFTATNLARAYHLFYRGKPAPDEAVLDSFQILAQRTKSPLNRWRDIMLTLCLSPHWQVL